MSIMTVFESVYSFRNRISTNVSGVFETLLVRIGAYLENWGVIQLVKCVL
jgi:hypothetical protein